MRAFIIRPFGIKEGIDFDHICATLIEPALAAAGVDGRTTLDILRAGNIRVDMFQRLLTADLVVADLTVHNANVFYELGIRHALRDKRTLLLRADIARWPFDLQTDRYLTYDPNRLDASRAQLVAAVAQTLASEKADSPVFQLLPELQAQDRSRFLVIPRDFHEDVARAEARAAGGDLLLYADEVRDLEWESEGWRVVGRAQFHLKDWQYARHTWEAVRKLRPDDLEANTVLGTVYQRLGDVVRSDQAVVRVLEARGTTAAERAEVLSLRARNAKTRWLAEWSGRPEAEWRAEALRSAYLSEALEGYDAAYSEDLNRFYPGINALALLKVQIALAEAQPALWANKFDDDTTAASDLDGRRRRAETLAAAVARALAAQRYRDNVGGGKPDVWAGISEADRLLLTDARPARVADAYRVALANAKAQAIESAASQLLIYEKLGVFEAGVQAALAAFPPAIVARARTAGPGAVPRIQEDSTGARVVLFSGHRIDPPQGSAQPRFPGAMEAVAQEAIRQALLDELALAGDAGVTAGIAGAASGGDILFHETCAVLGIPSSLHLALPPERFCAASVADGGRDWVKRFHDLVRTRPIHVLADSEALPSWLADKPAYDFWTRNNRWLFHNALYVGKGNVTLIALWDGRTGKEGGTHDLVEYARARGMRVVVLPTSELFGLPRDF
ncbi:MAG TPA: tetratricopeptide repeat-containing protein [Noviherbaspirillum sp.]|nr:tetratricopeptide repeat-containing protein [Noviherbaspirillum sp.]